MKRLDKRPSIYLIRHCSTKDSEEKRYSGRETPLNSKGINEAHKLAKEFVRIGIKRIYSSPYKRALETAKIIQNSCRCSLEIIDNLREIDHGLWTGYTVEEVKKIWKKEFDMRGKFPKIIPPPGGETLQHLQKRTLEALKEIIASNYQGKTLIVAHGGNIHTLWMFLLNVNLNDFWDFSKINKIECSNIYLLGNAGGLFLKRNSVSLVKI